MDRLIEFSIIIPVYNRLSLLKRCLSSLSNQTYKNFEVLICDDGSTEEIEAFIKNYNSDFILKYFALIHTGTPVYPRNFGIQKASGKWVCFLDSDDTFNSNKLEVLNKAFRDRCDFYYHKMNILNTNDKKIGSISPRQLDNTDPYIDLLCKLNPIATSSTCIKKEFLIKNNFNQDENLKVAEDFDLWLRLSKLNLKFKCINETLGNYYEEETGISKSFKNNINSIIYLYKKNLNGLSGNQLKSSRAALYFIVGRLLHINNYKRYNKFLLSSFLNGCNHIRIRVIALLIFN